MKCEESQEFVVGGFTDPQGVRGRAWGRCWSGISKDEEFVFAGKVGTGFDTKLLKELRARLDSDGGAQRRRLRRRSDCRESARTG